MMKLEYQGLRTGELELFLGEPASQSAGLLKLGGQQGPAQGAAQPGGLEDDQVDLLALEVDNLAHQLQLLDDLLEVLLAGQGVDCHVEILHELRPGDDWEGLEGLGPVGEALSDLLQEDRHAGQTLQHTVHTKRLGGQTFYTALHQSSPLPGCESPSG